MPIERCAEFLDWFLANVPIEPIWLCPVRLRDDDGWPLYPMRPDHTYVNVGFWSSVPVGADRGRDEPADRAQGQRARRAQVAVLRRLLLPGGVRRTLRRRGLPDREEDATTPTPVSSTSTRRRCNDDDHVQGEHGDTDSSRATGPGCTLAQILEILAGGRLPLRFTAYDGSCDRARRTPLGLDLVTPRGTTYLATAPGELGLARAYVVRRSRAPRRAPG